MNKVKIGIPKALLFYKYGNLWCSFFEELGCDIVISPNTNREILEYGNKYSVDEACLSMKIYMGHVYYLLDKCDYILVPRIICLKKNEKLCTNFYAFTTMGLELGFSYRKIVKAYKTAKQNEKLKLERKISKQKALIASSKKIKILLAGHPYNLYDDFIGKPIINLLEHNNIDIIYSDLYDKKYLNSEVNKISKKNYWTYNREIIAAISHYKDNVDGIILLTTFPCGPDSLSNEMILRSVDIPITNIIIDDESGEAGLITRIESFIDILEERTGL